MNEFFTQTVIGVLLLTWLAMMGDDLLTKMAVWITRKAALLVDNHHHENIADEWHAELVAEYKSGIFRLLMSFVFLLSGARIGLISSRARAARERREPYIAFPRETPPIDFDFICDSDTEFARFLRRLMMCCEAWDESCTVPVDVMGKRFSRVEEREFVEAYLDDVNRTVTTATSGTLRAIAPFATSDLIEQHLLTRARDLGF